MKKFWIPLFTIAAALLLGWMVVRRANAGEPEIAVGAMPELNYVTHLYTLAGLGFADVEDIRCA